MFTYASSITTYAQEPRAEVERDSLLVWPIGKGGPLLKLDIADWRRISACADEALAAAGLVPIAHDR